MPALTRARHARAAAATLAAAGALLVGATGCGPAATAPQPTATSSATRTAPSSPAATSAPAPASPSTPIAPASEFGNGTVYNAWIASVTPGSPQTVTMEMAWHYVGQAAEAYARAHGLPAPTDDHLDVDRKFSATVPVSPSVRASINPQGAGTQQLIPAAFLTWAAAHPARMDSGQYAGPIYSVTFSNDVLVSANEIFEP